MAKLAVANRSVREKLSDAHAERDDVDAKLNNADSGLRQQMSRELELKRSIADHKAKRAHFWLITTRSTDRVAVAADEAALQQMQTADYITKSRDFIALAERRDSLDGEIHVCTQVIDSLTDCLSVTGLEQLRGDTFREWLCDIGLRQLREALGDIDGESLTMLDIGSIIDMGVSFNDAAALQLRGYIAHNGLGQGPSFAPPSDAVIGWTTNKTASWIASLDPKYACLASAEWHGAALCSLSPTRVVEAAKGALKIPDAVKFINLVKAKRTECDGDKDEWIVKWNGANTVESQA